MPDRPSPFAEETKPSNKEAEAAHSRLSAESQSALPTQQSPEVKPVDAKQTGVPPLIPHSSDLQPIVIPPFTKLDLHLDKTTQSERTDNWKIQEQNKKSEETNALDTRLQELARKEWEKPFATSQPALLISAGLCPYSVGLNSPSMFGALNRGLGAGVLSGMGVWQASKDYHNLLNSESTQGTMKYGAALALDASIVSGGVLSLAKYGPTWLAPALLIGGVAGRMAIDLIPNRK